MAVASHWRFARRLRRPLFSQLPRSRELRGWSVLLVMKIFGHHGFIRLVGKEAEHVRVREREGGREGKGGEGRGRVGKLREGKKKEA